MRLIKNIFARTIANDGETIQGLLLNGGSFEIEDWKTAEKMFATIKVKTESKNE
jgi:hypothetical protein